MVSSLVNLVSRTDYAIIANPGKLISAESAAFHDGENSVNRMLTRHPNIYDEGLAPPA
jgi:hypothetical protein